MNKWFDVEHGKIHLINGQWCEPLTSAKEFTNDDDDSQDVKVHFNECE